MPPLLAALLMMEFGCDFRIIKAIDLTEEWRRPSIVDYEVHNEVYYDGWLGYDDKPLFSAVGFIEGTYFWPKTCLSKCVEKVPKRRY